MAAVLVLCASLALVACGDSESSSDSTSESGGEASSGALAAFEEKVEEGFAKSSGPQTTKPPSSGPPAETGKSIAVIPCAMAAEGCGRPARAAMEAAEAIGWKATLIDPAGDPQKMGAAVTRAESLGVDGIALMAIDSATIQEPLEKAKKAGIFLSCFACVDKVGVYDSLIPPESELPQAGYTIAQAAYKLSGGNVQMIQMIDKEFEVLGLRLQGTDEFIEECQQSGGECEVIDQANYLITELSTKLPSITSTVARQNPDFTVLWGDYDAAMTFMAQGIKQAGLGNGDQFGVSFDANEANLDEIREGGFERATVGLPMQWVAFAMVDDLNRLMAGEETVEQGVQYKLLYDGNLPPEGAWDGDSDVRPVYMKIWGK
jgi:ribose transport system substrate-binding protein